MVIMLRDKNPYIDVIVWLAINNDCKISGLSLCNLEDMGSWIGPNVIVASSDVDGVAS